MCTDILFISWQRLGWERCVAAEWGALQSPLSSSAEKKGEKSGIFD